MSFLKIGELSEVEKTGDPVLLTTARLPNLEPEISKIDIPRASTLYDACIRMHVISTLLKITKITNHNLNMRVTFGIGNAVHWWLQNTPAILGEERYGLWKCTACGNIRRFGPPIYSNCPNCKASPYAIQYYEFGDIIDTPFKFSFHVDMFRKVNNFYRVEDFKTVGEDEFHKLSSVRIKDEWQITTYIMGCLYSKKFKEKIDHKIGYVYYICKKHVQNQLAIKILPVIVNKHVVKAIQNKLSDYKNGLINYPKNIPKIHKECEERNFDCWRTKMCVVKEECRKL